MNLYIVKNTSKSVHTRTVRAIQPGRVGSIQRICGGRVRLGRGDSVTLTEDQLREYYNELAGLQTKGLVEVRVDGINGPKFEFTLTKPMEETPIPVPSKEPEPEPEPEDDEDEEEEVSVEVETPTEPDKPIDRMNKSELISYASEVLGESSEELELLTKKQIMEKLS